jgi:hypothetical protein
MTHRRLIRRYVFELGFAHVLFFAILFSSGRLAPKFPPGLVHDLLIGSPAFPAALMLVVVARFYRGSDEYQRLRMLENWAITAAITFLWTFIYGLLENAGLPHLNLCWICPAMAAASMLVLVVRGQLQRHLA